MAVRAATTATAATAEAFPRVLPSPSPFSELLRRSRFATFDPEIRQTYTAPSSYTSRGNYGLKRPLAKKGRSGAVVLKNFEEHAHYIDWNNASEQVRLVKRVEELNVGAKVSISSHWAASLTAGTSASGFDSEFCPGETSAMEQPVAAAEPPAEPEPPLRVAIEDLPSSGPGSYGSAEPVVPIAQARSQKISPQINFNAMAPERFEDYVKTLQELRPQFIAFLRKEIKNEQNAMKQSDKTRNNGVINEDEYPDFDKMTDNEFMTEIGPAAWNQNYHVRFLGAYTEAKYHVEQERPGNDRHAASVRQKRIKEANTPQPIQPNPHKLAGLVYAEPTPLETYYTSAPTPGFYLQDNDGKRFDRGDRHIASHAGIAAYYKNPGAGVPPLFDHSKGLIWANLQRSERMMRPEALHIEDPPQVVGKNVPDEPLHKVQLRHQVVDTEGEQNSRSNPYRPGSWEYMSQPTASPILTMNRLASGSLGTRRATLDTLGSNMYHKGYKKYESRWGAGTNAATQSMLDSVSGMTPASTSSSGTTATKDTKEPSVLDRLGAIAPAAAPFKLDPPKRARSPLFTEPKTGDEISRSVSASKWGLPRKPKSKAKGDEGNDS